MTAFVLVPGAWLGAWAWEDTARALRAQGHTALPLTLTGLGEYAGRGTPETDLETHIADITGFVERRDLREVTLVAHSYAGAPVTGAAGRLGTGWSVWSTWTAHRSPPACACSTSCHPGLRTSCAGRSQSTATGGGCRCRPSRSWRLSSSLDGLDENKRELLRTRATPQPFGTYEQRLTGPAEPSPGVDRVLVACNDFRNLLDAGVPMLAFLSQPPWRRFDLCTGHWPMLSAPAELASVLGQLS